MDKLFVSLTKDMMRGPTRPTSVISGVVVQPHRKPPRSCANLSLLPGLDPHAFGLGNGQLIHSLILMDKLFVSGARNMGFDPQQEHKFEK